MALMFSSCRPNEEINLPTISSGSESVIILDVWDSSNPPALPRFQRDNKKWNNEKVEIYLDNVLLGITPLQFTPKIRHELGLPDYQNIDIDNESHWTTWETGFGCMEIAHPEDRESKRTLHFKTTSTPKRDLNLMNLVITGYESTSIDGLTIWLHFPIE